MNGKNGVYEYLYERAKTITLVITYFNAAVMFTAFCIGDMLVAKHATINTALCGLFHILIRGMKEE